MKKILTLLILTMALLACGDARPQTEAQAKALSHNPPTPFSYTANNSQTVFPSARESDSLCTIMSVIGAGGHSGSANWPNGVPKLGAVVGISQFPGGGPNQPIAHLSTTTAVAGQGNMAAEAKCFPFSYFENTWQPPWQSHSGSVLVNQYTEGDGQGPHTGDLTLWEGDSYCFLDGYGGLSHHDEQAFLWKQTDPNALGGFLWKLRVIGSGRISGWANCVYFGRPYETHGIKTAYTNAPVDLDWTPNEAVCTLTGVWGNADDGTVAIAPTGPWGQYRLSVSGGIWAAQAQCVSYWDPQN